MGKNNYYEKNKDIILDKAKQILNRSKDYQKQYRECKTDEQKQKMKEYQKEYIKDITDEQKQKRKDYQKKYRENKKILKQQNKDLSIIYKILKRILLHQKL